MIMHKSHRDVVNDTVLRTFLDFTDEDIVDFQRVSALLSPTMVGGIAWQELLQSQRILLVAEAGAGKTYECRQQKDSLWKSGEAAFFFELATLANTEPREMLLPEEEERFDAWLMSQSDIATFFLDSIDELKLTLGSFEQALRRFGRALSGQLGRSRIVITTRPIPFDRQTIQRFLPVPDPKNEFSAERFADIATGRNRSEMDQKPAHVWRSVGLMPLTKSQIRQMANAQQISDVDGLMDDIRRRNAEDFVRRPQDLIELCADWKSARRIRTHREQVAQNVSVKLLPRRNERAALTAEKALEGARRLALAALLTRKLTIRHSAEADKGGPNERALDPAVVLYDWTAEERETLLERALFGFASYGRVRFHHRSVTEYLAGEQIEVQLTKGMPFKAVKRLLFAETGQGLPVVRPSMRPVAAWLSSHPIFFREVLQREPDVLLNFGDPQSLDLAQRRDALRAYVACYGSGGWRGLSVPLVQAHRFISPELADDVGSLWQSGVENPEVRQLLLTLIEVGRLRECEHIAAEVALARETEPHERLSAVDALIALDSRTLDDVIQQVERQPAIWTDQLVQGLVPRIFPEHLKVDQLAHILRRVRDNTESVGGFGWQLPRVISATEFPARLLEPMRKCLDELITEGATWAEEWPHFTTTGSHLASALAEVCNKLIESGKKNPEIFRSTVLALRFGRENATDGGPVARLRKAIRRFSSTEREEAFWAEDAFLQSLHRDMTPWERLWEISDAGAIALNAANDTTWVTAQLANESRSTDDRALLLEAAIRFLCPSGTEWQDYVRGLKVCVGNQSSLIARIEDALKPKTVDPKHEKLERDMARRRKEQERAEEDARNSWVAFWNEIAQNPEAAFGEKRAYNTVWSLWKAMELVGSNSRSEGWNRRFIEGNFGKDTADRMRRALAPIWREDPPTLAMERKPKQRNIFYVRWQLGLAAIAAESEDPDWAIKLSEEEAAAAARHIPIELNSFPSWIDALVSAHVRVVESVIGAELSFELERSARSPYWSSSILQKIAQATPSVASIFLPRLRQWLGQHGNRLRKTEDINAASERLSRVLEILIQYGDMETIDHLKMIAGQRLRRVGCKFEGAWLKTLFHLDPAGGVVALERILCPIPVCSDSPALDWFASLFGERHRSAIVDLSHIDFTPSLLLRLVRQAYKHVRLADDVVREGSFSPDRRDHAERGRNAILSALLATTGPTGWAAKLELASDPIFFHIRDRTIALAQEKAAEEVDGEIFNENAVADLNKYNEAPPASSESMFALLRDRLDDLDELLLEDVSPRESWSSIRDERVMRREIARELRNNSNHSYTVDQESATADEKETDIRLRAMSGQQAVIELKIGEKPRSAADLRNALRDQLIKKYMASTMCRVGCLMITIGSKRNWTHPETNASLDFNGLISWLNAEAKTFASDLGGGLLLVVKGLDLCPRLGTEREAQADRSHTQRRAAVQSG